MLSLLTQRTRRCRRQSEAASPVPPPPLLSIVCQCAAPDWFLGACTDMTRMEPTRGSASGCLEQSDALRYAERFGAATRRRRRQQQRHKSRGQTQLLGRTVQQRRRASRSREHGQQSRLREREVERDRRVTVSTRAAVSRTTRHARSCGRRRDVAESTWTAHSGQVEEVRGLGSGVRERPRTSSCA